MKDEYGNKIDGSAAWSDDGRQTYLKPVRPSGVRITVGWVQAVGVNWYWEIKVRPTGNAVNGYTRSKVSAQRAVQRAAGIILRRAKQNPSRALKIKAKWVKGTSTEAGTDKRSEGHPAQSFLVAGRSFASRPATMNRSASLLSGMPSSIASSANFFFKVRNIGTRTSTNFCGVGRVRSVGEVIRRNGSAPRQSAQCRFRRLPFPTCLRRLPVGAPSSAL